MVPKRPEPRDSFPLQWPNGWERTASDARVRSQYKVLMSDARDEIMRHLGLLGAKWVAITTNIPTRRDGAMYAQFNNPEDPGVAVYWCDKKGTEKVMACDKYRTLRENTRAVGLSIAALRQLERAGASQILDRAFEGFAALPADIALARPWRSVLELNGAASLEDVEAAFRRLSKLYHPDVPGTGSSAKMQELNHAREDAHRELQP